MAVKGGGNVFDFPIDSDNEGIIIANAIKSPLNREIFVRSVTHNKFRNPQFKTVAWGIIEAVKDNLEINLDAVLLKSRSCPVRHSVDFTFLQQVVNNFDEVPEENFKNHVEKLTIDSTKQQMLDFSLDSLMKTCTDPTSTLADLANRITYAKNIVESGYSSSRLDFKPMIEIVAEYDEMKLKGVDKRPTGFPQLDEFLTEGFKEGQITTLAGLSSMGKSSMALTIMKNLSQGGFNRPPVPTAQFALEMNNMSITSKLLAFGSNLPLKRVVRKPEDLTPQEREHYEAAKKFLAENKYIFLNDNPSQSIKSMGEQIKLLQDKLKQQYIVIVVDLFGKIKDLQGSDNFARDYEKKLNEIQVLVRELQIHMILVAQINKEVSKRKNKRPTMNDMKNAGALTEVSDIMLGINRPYYDSDKAMNVQMINGLDDDYSDDEEQEESMVEDDPNRNLAELIILKQRMGPKDVLINFIFDPRTTCFYPITEEYQRRINLLKVDEES